MYGTWDLFYTSQIYLTNYFVMHEGLSILDRTCRIHDRTLACINSCLLVPVVVVDGQITKSERLLSPRHHLLSGLAYKGLLDGCGLIRISVFGQQYAIS